MIFICINNSFSSRIKVVFFKIHYTYLSKYFLIINSLVEKIIFKKLRLIFLQEKIID